MNNNRKSVLVLVTMLTSVVGVILSATTLPQQQVLAQNTTAGNNMTGTGNTTLGSVSGVDQDEVAEAIEVPPGPTVERHPCPGQYVISWSPAICVPYPKGCPDMDNPKCPPPALPPTEPAAEEQPEEGQPDVQPPADQADEAPADEESTGEGEGSEINNN